MGILSTVRAEGDQGATAGGKVSNSRASSIGTLVGEIDDVESRPVSVVVPTIRDSAPTLECVPDDGGVDVVVRRDEGLNRARNQGVRAAEEDAILLLDDDLVFSEEWFDGLARLVRARPRSVFTAHGTGILPQLQWPEGFTPGMGRVMGFNRETWRDIGGFPTPCDHGGDTDFLMSAYEADRRIVSLEHEWEHRDDEIDQYTFWNNIDWLWFLLRRHPALLIPRIPGLVRVKLQR